MGRLLLLVAALWVAAPAQATLTISVNYTGDPQYAGLFTSAASTWESLLVGYQEAGRSINVQIEASVAPIDGPNMILAQAGPTNLIVVPSTGFAHATAGQMFFDSADIGSLAANNTFDDVILHEMAHVLGFGTLWNFQTGGTTYNDVYDSGAGVYTGASATAAWQSEFGQAGNPLVEQSGGPGTADGHWDEVDNDQPNGLSPLQPTGITDLLGRDLRDELMTGYLTAPFTPDVYISQMTLNSFIDIGFIGSVVAVPEAGSFLAFGLVSFFGVATGRRRS